MVLKTRRQIAALQSKLKFYEDQVEEYQKEQARKYFEKKKEHNKKRQVLNKENKK